MLKNIKIGVKLIVVGTLIMVIPLLVVALVAISKSTQGLAAVENEQLAGRSSNIAQIIDRVFGEEKKLSLSFAIDPDIVAAAIAVSEKPVASTEKGTAVAEKPATGRAASGKTTPAPVVDNGAAATGELLNRATAKINRFMQTKGLGDDYQVLVCIGLDGIPFAASDPTYLNVNFSDRGYVKTALAGTVNAGQAALNKVTKKPFAPFAAPIRSGDKIVGVFAAIADISFLNELITGEKIGATGYSFVTDNTGLVLAHPKAENIFTLNISKLQGMEELSKKMSAGESGVHSYVFQGVPKTAGYAPIKATGWSVCLTLPDSEYLTAANDVRNLILLISAIAIVIAFLIYLVFSRTITKPLARGVSFAELVASGDFTQQLPIHQKDEIGKLAEALNGMAIKLKGVVATIQDSAEQVASSSEEITASAQKLAEGAQSQASTLEETSASVEELTASVDQVAEHAQSQAAAVEQGSSSMAQVHQSIEDVSKNLTEIAVLAGKSVENALEGAKAVSEVMEGINLIAASSEKIGGIVNVISDIADQTNLLALNASIEAARAGEHGRGFAVVADEVSKLADRSSTSTKEIENLIKESVKNVNKGVETAKGSQAAMEQIRTASQKVKEMISGLSDSMTQQVEAVKELSKALGSISEMSQSISAATEEQTTNAKQVSVAVENVNEVTQSAASAAEEMSSATEQLASMAQELQRMMAQFKIEDGNEVVSRQPKPVAVDGNGNGKGKTVGKELHFRELPAVVAVGTN
ncbi:MAG: methyl-accepting chemotaxis protein [Rectinemataceae bacterium]|jgi:methyl-accepting chemotaxis protein